MTLQALIVDDEAMNTIAHVHKILTLRQRYEDGEAGADGAMEAMAEEALGILDSATTLQVLIGDAATHLETGRECDAVRWIEVVVRNRMADDRATRRGLRPIGEAVERVVEEVWR